MPVYCINLFPKNNGYHPTRSEYSVYLSYILFLTFWQDVRYLKPYVEDVEREDKERQLWDSMSVTRK
jgi:hypothetical protein